jgi:AsmA protein
MARDVALATGKHRVALQGELDFVNEKFDDVTVALIDAEGCTKVRQTIQGSFQKPEVEQPSVLKTLTGPVRKLIKLGKELFPGGECEAFYAGSVAAPK